MSWEYVAVTWTPGVSDRDARVFIRSLEQIYGTLKRHFGKPGQFNPLPHLRIFGSWSMPNVPEHTPYRSILDYVQGSLSDDEETVSLLTSRYLHTVKHEPWQTSNPHFDFLMTNLPVYDDLAGQHHEPVTGFYRTNKAALLSLHPISHVHNPRVHDLLLRRMVSHYWGRLFGALEREYECAEIGGTVSCANLCSMRHTLTAEHAIDHALQEAAEGLIYCATCQRELISRLVSFHFGAN